MNEKQNKKAMEVMKEKDQTEQELKAKKLEMIAFEEESKRISNQMQRMLKERLTMEKMLKDIEAEIAEARATLDGQKRLITNMSGHAKNKSISHNSTRSSLDQV